MQTDSVTKEGSTSPSISPSSLNHALCDGDVVYVKLRKGAFLMKAGIKTTDLLRIQ
jgi:hypothetical protein